ncbi:SET domain-containing protein [Patescibacteria group bacterium]|nr:SET domain-containing protein [Patescibacteria group bacterium]
MLLVETELRSSQIHELGLFAKDFIPKGKEIWRYVSNFDLIIDEKERSEIIQYMYKRQIEMSKQQ